MSISSSSTYFLRKRGPYVVPPPNNKDPSTEEFHQLVVGKFLNDKDFEIEEIRA